MTIGGWVLFGFIALCAFGIAIAVGYWNDSKTTWIVALVAALFVTVITLPIEFWYFSSTESGKRAVKDQESNLQGGIRRAVSVYDMEGDLIQEYSGEFDVEMHDTYILFDDEQGKRHIIYFTTGTVVIDER
jgi:hypothetical protein